MAGKIDWAGLPVIMELLQVEDAEGFLYQLFALREHMTEGLDGDE